MPVTTIQVSTEFTKTHQRVLVQYVVNPNSLTQSERQDLFQAIDHLRYSHVVVDGISLTFSEFYNRFVDEVYADMFINVLLESKEVMETKDAEISKAWRRPKCKSNQLMK